MNRPEKDTQLFDIDNSQMLLLDDADYTRTYDVLTSNIRDLQDNGVPIDEIKTRLKCAWDVDYHSAIDALVNQICFDQKIKADTEDLKRKLLTERIIATIIIVTFSATLYFLQ